MAKSGTNGALPSANQDDFRKIKKITQPVARALAELKINRYADLAGLTPEILADLLRTKNVPFVSAQRIEREDWIGQARALTEGQEEKPGVVELTTQDPSSDLPEAVYSPAADSQKEPGHGNWRELADFFVSFGEEISTGGKAQIKTKAHFSQGDRTFEQDGIATAALLQWMLSQANLPLVEEESQALSPSAPAEAPAEVPAGFPAENPPGQEIQYEEPLPLLISNLWVSQVDHPAPGGRLAFERMIRVEADVDVSPEAGVFLTGLTPFMVSIYLINTQTNESIFIETPTISASQADLPYPFQYDFPVPPPGRYQIYLLAGLPSAGKAPILQQGPIVRVEG